MGSVIGGVTGVLVPPPLPPPPVLRRNKSRPYLSRIERGHISMGCVSARQFALDTTA